MAKESGCPIDDILLNVEGDPQMIREELAALVQDGLVRDSGKRPNGQILWEATPLGVELAAASVKPRS
jgi:hypothetical protein